MERPLIIAEVAQTHDGSLGLAHAFIDAVTTTGADAIKFQTHMAEAESTPGEPFRVPFSFEDKSRFEYWRRMEFTPEQWAGLKAHAEAKSLLFISSPFSIEAADLLTGIGIKRWKVGSGEFRSRHLLAHLAATGKPMIVSTGLSRWDEIEAMAAFLRERGVADLTLLQCTTAYPAPFEKAGLNVLGEMAARTGCAVGLSDHSGTIFPSLAAVTLGASVVEVHVTLSREMFGPDVAASLTTAELRTLVEGVHAIHVMRTHPVDKDEAARAMEPMRTIFSKGAYAARGLAAGTALQPSDLCFKKPCAGLTEAECDALIGRPLARSVERGTALRKEDFES